MSTYIYVDCRKGEAHVILEKDIVGHELEPYFWYHTPGIKEPRLPHTQVIDEAVMIQRGNYESQTVGIYWTRDGAFARNVLQDVADEYENRNSKPMKIFGLDEEE